MLWVCPLLMVLLALAPWKETKGQQPEGFYVRSPIFGFFMAPRRAITRSNATHVLTNKVSNCTCKNACFALIPCQAWSVVKFQNGSAECRLSSEGPATGELEDNPHSTYFFRESSTCSVTMASKLPTYPREMMEDVALFKKAQGSPEYNSAEVVANTVDGDLATKFTSQQLINPWMMVDLGEEKTIFMITLHPIYRSYSHHFSNVEVRFGNSMPTNGNFSSHPLLFTYAGPYDNTYGELLYFCRGVTGRYLSVQIKSTASFFFVMNTFQAFAIKN